MARFELHATPISGLVVVERRPIADERGFLTRLFCATELAKAGWTKPVAQINHTLTRRRGAVRGLHFQRMPHAEMKLVTCLEGTVWDVAVDLRAGSPTFLQWYAAELSLSNSRALLIPEGCAHGFQALEEDSQLLYCHSTSYAPESEGIVNVRDPRLGIAWPEPIIEQSARDLRAEPLPAAFRGLES